MQRPQNKDVKIKFPKHASLLRFFLFLNTFTHTSAGGGDGPSVSPPNDSTTVDIGVGNPTVFFWDFDRYSGVRGLVSELDVSLSVAPEPSTMAGVSMSMAEAVIWT